MKTFTYFVFSIFAFIIIFKYVPLSFDLLHEINKQETICEYKYNIDKCYYDYGNEYFTVFRTDKGYKVVEK